MLKLKEPLYLWVHTSSYDGAQSFITMNRKGVDENKIDLKDWDCFEIESVPTAKKVKVTPQPSKVEYL